MTRYRFVGKTGQPLVTHSMPHKHALTALPQPSAPAPADTLVHLNSLLNPAWPNAREGACIDNMPIVGMDKGRTVLALLLVSLGSALAVAGPVALGRVGLLIASHIYVLFFAAAALSVFLTVLPRGTRVGPAMLFVAGVVAYIAAHGRGHRWDPWALAGLMIALLGGGLSMATSSRKRTEDVDPVKRVWAIAFPRTSDFQDNEWTPQLISACAIGAKLTIDLRSPAEARGKYVELAIACWAGRVEIIPPDHWPIVAGRLAQTKGIRFSGNLDSSETFSDPRDQAQYNKLGEIVDKWRRLHTASTEPTVVVVHVMGLGGQISLVGRT